MATSWCVARPSIGLRVGDATKRALSRVSCRPRRAPGLTPGSARSRGHGATAPVCQRGAPSLASAWQCRLPFQRGGCLAGAANARRWMSWWRACAQGRAGRWCCAGRPGSARARCSSIWCSTRPGAASPGRRASSRRWSSRSRGCSSCARRSWIASSAYPARSATRWAPRSVCATATRRIGSSSAWRS